MKRSLGLRAYQKAFGTDLNFRSIRFVCIGVWAAVYTFPLPISSGTWSYFYVPIIAFIMVGTVNSVNLTDGLDGLASGVTLIVSMTISIIAAFAGYAMEEGGLVI